MNGISIKTTTITGTRSRGRVATRTRTLFRRNIDPDAHPAVIMSVMSGIIPMLEHTPVSYQVHGVRYDLLRLERRTENGRRVERAVFKDERDIHKSFAREMRRRHRATRKHVVRAGRDETRRRVACAAALLAMARAAQIKRTAQNTLAARASMPVLPSLYISALTPEPIQAIPSG